MTTHTEKLDEPELPDDYPMHWSYFYIFNGELARHLDEPMTVGECKKKRKLESIRRCDAVARGLL